MWQSISSTTQLICIEARTKEATKKEADDLWYFVVIGRDIVTSWHVDMTPREEWSWLVPAGPGVGNPHARDAGAEGLKCWGWWDWEDLKSFFTQKQAALCKTSFFIFLSSQISSSLAASQAECRTQWHWVMLPRVPQKNNLGKTLVSVSLESILRRSRTSTSFPFELSGELPRIKCIL